MLCVGMFLVIFGSLGDFAALGFAPQTLVTPVGGFTMVANVLFAHFFLKEAFSRRVRTNNCVFLDQFKEINARMQWQLY